jgi:hypothetical protein
MHAKGIRRFLAPVMIMGAVGCDNVEFGGFHVELQAPAPAQGMPEEIALPDSVPAPLAPIATGPVLYLVERGEGSEASLVAVAAVGEDGYEALPAIEETPDLVERFAIGRFESATEFVLFSRGTRVGTFVADGTAGSDTSTCRVRPLARGRVEVRPEAVGERRFLAIAKDDLSAVGLETASDPVPLPDPPSEAVLDAGSVTAAQIAMPEMDVPWPASIPGARRDLQPLAFEGDGGQGLATTLVYGGELRVGPELPVAYSLFIASIPVGTRYEPVVAWYQRNRQDGKAFPRLLAAHDVGSTGTPDLLFEVFGDEARWLALLGSRDGEWSMLYEDPCGLPAARGGIRTFP